MTIEEWIEKLEEEDVPLEEFYARLVHARHAIDQRIEVAVDDDIDVENLEPYEGD